MSGKRRDRHRKAARRAPFLPPKPRILIVCEGKVTEPDYLNGLCDDARNQRVAIEIVPGGMVPLSLVKTARNRKEKADVDAQRQQDENLKFEQVWAVFDVDQHPHFEEASRLAEQHDIKLAISNPCFELWLLLHFEAPPGITTTEEMRQRLKTHDQGYEKSVTFSKYKDGYRTAINGSKQLDQLAQSLGHPGRNPTTGVYRLAELIREETPPASTPS